MKNEKENSQLSREEIIQFLKMQKFEDFDVPDSSGLKKSCNKEPRRMES